MTKRDYYEVLGIDRRAGEEEIKKAGEQAFPHKVASSEAEQARAAQQEPQLESYVERMKRLGYYPGRAEKPEKESS